jgi:hypothetical protein
MINSVRRFMMEDGEIWVLTPRCLKFSKDALLQRLYRYEVAHTRTGKMSNDKKGSLMSHVSSS